jgi:hypothetical protein
MSRFIAGVNVSKNSYPLGAGPLRTRPHHTRCRVAYIVDGVDGYAPWRPISEYEALKAGAKRVTEMGEIRAWVQRQ